MLLNPSDKSLAALDSFDTFSRQNREFLSNHISDLEDNPSQRNYSRDLFPFLPLEVQKSFYNLAISDNEINNWLISYFGFRPHIHRISLLLNVSKDNAVEEGSKLWHRDDDCDFKNTKVFIPFTLQTSETGPFFYLTEPALYTKKYSLKPLMKSNDPWRRWRISNDSIFSHHFSFSSLQNIPVGSMLCIDTVNTYHKGGYLSNGHRVLLQISYQGDSYNSTPRQDLSYLDVPHSSIFNVHQKISSNSYHQFIVTLKKILSFLGLTQLLKTFFKKLSSSRFYSITLN